MCAVLHNTIVLSDFRTKHAEAALSFYASKMWNHLPAHCRTAPTLISFKTRLQTFLLVVAYSQTFLNLINFNFWVLFLNVCCFLTSLRRLWLKDAI